MMSAARKILYYYAKFLKKIRGSAILNSNIGYDSKIEPGSSFINSRIEKHSYVGYDSTIINTRIGSFCSIANNVKIGGATHPVHFVSTSPVFLSHKDSVKEKFAYHDFLPEIYTDIGHDVWIGENALIKSGVSIGIGSVIGMGSVVTKDVPAYAIVAGNPAKIIKFRFDPNMVDALLASEWWKMGKENLKKYGKFFNDPKKLLSALGS